MLRSRQLFNQWNRGQDKEKEINCQFRQIPAEKVGSQSVVSWVVSREFKIRRLRTTGAIHSTTIQPQFHLKRWTSFFETFLVGPNRSIEFWTEISGNFGWMVRACTTTVKNATALDQNHVTVHFSRVILRLRVSCWAVSHSRDYGEHFARILPFGNSRISSFRKKVFNLPALSEREAKYVSCV